MIAFKSIFSVRVNSSALFYRKGIALVVTALLLLSLSTIALGAEEERAPLLSQHPKISDELWTELRKLSPMDPVKIIIHLEEQFSFPPEMKSAPRNKKVKYMKNLTEKSQAPLVSALRAYGAGVRAKFWVINSLAATLPAGLVETIASLPNIGRIELDKELQIFSMSSSDSWIFPKDQLAALDVARAVTRADNVHAAGYDGTGIKIGVLDTGIQDTHPWLQRNGASVVIEKWDATVDPPDNLPSDTYRADHGTEVAGVIASQDNIYKGIAPGSNLIDILVMDTAGTIYTSYLITGIQLAIDRGCDIASVSIGGHETRNDGTRTDSIAFDRAFYYGVLSSIAIGNEGPSTMSTSAPADGRQVISVAAYDDNNTTDTADDIPPSWAQQGPSAFGWFDPDISAPGVDITTSKPVDTSATVSGTSFSTPHVAGIAALVMQKYPTMNPETVRLAVVSTARDMGFHPWTQGAGSADAYSAVMSGLYAGVHDWAIYRDPSAPENIIASEMVLYPFWNVYIQPGHKTKTEITIFNYSTSEVTLTTSDNAYADYDNALKTLGYTLSIADNVTVPAEGRVNVPVSIEVPAGQDAGTWPIYLKFSNDNKQVIVPICVTVLLDFTAISGYLEGETNHVIDDYYQTTGPPSYQVIVWGDTFAFGFHNSALNEEEVVAILEWTRRKYQGIYQDLGIFLYNAKRTYLGGATGTGGSLTVTTTTSLDTGIWWIIIFANSNYQQGYKTRTVITAQEKSGTLLIAATTHSNGQERTLDIYATAVSGVDGKLTTGTINFTLYRDNGDLYWDNIADTATSITGVLSYNSSTSRFENEGIDISSLYTDSAMYYAWSTMTDAGGYSGEGGSTFFTVVVVPALGVSIAPATYGFGLMELNQTENTGTSGYFTITNTGGDNEDFTIRGTDASDGQGHVWILDNEPGPDKYKLEYSKDGESWVVIKKTAQVLAVNVAPSGTVRIDLRISTPTYSTETRWQYSFQIIIGAVSS